MTIRRWREWARQLKVQVYALYFAYRDPRVPLHARLFAVCVAGYALSPIDLIPDPIPILGQLDDLVLIPLGVWVTLRMIPEGVWADCREKAVIAASEGRPVNRIAALVIIAVWLLMALFAIRLLTGWLVH